MTPSDALDGPELFAEWLHALNPAAVAGVCGSPASCPLVRFAHVVGVLSDDDWEAGVTARRLQGVDERGSWSYDLPEWAVRFVRRFDAAGAEHEELTAAVAITALEEALEVPA